jgi:hypothetical protein
MGQGRSRRRRGEGCVCVYHIKRQEYNKTLGCENGFLFAPLDENLPSRYRYLTYGTFHTPVQPCFSLAQTTCLVFSVLSFLFSGCMRNRRRRRRRGAPLSVACLLAVGPVEGTFTYVTACRPLLHLVSSRSGFWRHVQRSGKMRSDLSVG